MTDERGMMSGMPNHKPGTGSVIAVRRVPVDGPLHYGDSIEYDVSSPSTKRFANVNVYEAGVWVMSSNILPLPLPAGYDVVLSWEPWHAPGVQAEGVATLYDQYEHVLAQSHFTILG